MRPRRRGKTFAARVKPFWMPIAVVAALAATGIGFGVTWPGFRPQAIYVSGNHVVTRAEIVARAGISPRESIWLQNARAIRLRIEAIPYVASAAVHRRVPASVSIVVTERAPYAVLRSGEDSAVADHSLRVLAVADGSETLPVFVLPPGIVLVPGVFVTLPAAAALRKAQDALADKGILPASLGFDRFGGLVVELRGGVRVLLGSQSDLESKLALVKPILAQVVGEQRRVAAIDLRAPGTPVVVYR